MWFAAKTFIMIESSTTIYSGRQAFCLLLSMIGETFLLIVFPNSNNNSNQRAQTPPKPKSDPGFESGFPGYSGSGSGSWYLLPICFGFIRSVILWEMLINLLNPLFHNGERSGKVIRNPYPGPDHHQKLVTSRGSLLVPMPTMFHAYIVDVRYHDRELSCSPYDRQNDRTNDHITPPALAK